MTHQLVKYNQQEGDRGSRNAKGKYTTETDTVYDLVLISFR